jgi:hypothetical protein
MQSDSTRLYRKLLRFFVGVKLKTVCYTMQLTSMLKGFVLMGFSLMQKQLTPFTFDPVMIGCTHRTSIDT